MNIVYLQLGSNIGDREYMLEATISKIKEKIGEDIGFITKSGWEMIDREGVICTT